MPPRACARRSAPRRRKPRTASANQASLEVRAEKERLAALLNSIRDEVWFVDVSGQLTLVNPSVMREFHLPEGPLDAMAVAQSYEVLRRDGSPRPVEEAPPFRALKGETLDCVEEIVRTPASGELRYREVTASPVRDATGAIVGSVSVVRDVTRRKRAEEALREANARLAAADRRKDEFLAMLAHELRNPLSVLGGASEILQRTGGAEPEVRRAHDAIQRQARHMARLVDDLLDVSRVTQGKIGLKQERVPVADVLGHAADVMTPTVHALGHKLFVSLPPEPLSVSGDAVRLTQIVTNLLNNAAKYTPAGGEIHLSAERRGARVEIRVRDNGQGIDAALLPHVFDLFVQGDRGADRAQGGLGIGLTMARSLVEMHGGTIEGHSDGPGTGSEFVIVLPLVEPVAEPGIETERVERPGARRILVVDDNADAVEMMRTLLELDGNEVTAVQDGLAAIQCALAWRPDVALIDLGMPGVDGFEVARRLRAEPSLERTVLVALTGYGQEEDIRRSREAGFHHHVTKSADFVPLRRVLESIRGVPQP